MQLKPLHHAFSVCKVADYSLVHWDAPYCFIGKTEEENSLVCITEDVPANATICEDGWRAFRIQGVLDFSLTGILAGISAILAEHEIGIFAVSTFNTDYVLTKAESFERALDVLQAAGYEVLWESPSV